MAIIYAFANQKGGVGKTTSVINIAAYLAESGQKTLIIDLDPQANATSAFGFDKNADRASTYELLLEQTPSVETAVLVDEESNVHIYPASPSLAGAEVELVNLMAREHRLQKGIQPLVSQFDYILIDCPPSLGMLTLNGLSAAKDGVIIPVQCEYLALEGLSQLLETIDLVKTHLHQGLKIRGLILTMYDGRTKLARGVVDDVRQHFPSKVFRAIVPRNVRLSEAPSYGQPINVYAPDSTGAFGYKVLTAELLQGDKGK